MVTIAEQKQQLRLQYLKLRDALSPAMREEFSSRIAALLTRLIDYNDAATIACYASVRSEVATAAILRHALDHGKMVYLPRMSAQGIELLKLTALEELTPNARGIPEPPATAERIAPHAIELFIIPAVAIDKAGNRLGYGPGNYDRLLAANPRQKIALAYSMQIAPMVPAEPHDVPVDMIATENEIIRCR